MPTVLGHTASKNEELDPTKSDGQSSLLSIVRSSQRGRDPKVAVLEFKSRDLISSLEELS